MANRRKILIALLIISVLVYFGGLQATQVGGGEEVSVVRPTAFQPFFADIDRKEIPVNLGLENAELFSTVTAGGISVGDAFYVRFNVRVKNTGASDVNARPSAVELFDGNNVKITILEDEVLSSFSCLLDEPVVTIPGNAGGACTIDSDCGGVGFTCDTGECVYTWDTSPVGGNTGCTDLNWLFTPPMETEYQGPPVNALTFVITFEGDTVNALTGVRNQLVKQSSILMTFNPGGVLLGDFAPEVVYGDGDVLLEECQFGVDPPIDCPFGDITPSACSGIQQVCGSNGFYEGCTTDVYEAANPAFNPGFERTGGLNLCYDGIDNDCDGYTDKREPDATCVRATAGNSQLVDCDSDCPVCAVTYRSNIDEAETDLSQYLNSFVLVDIDGDFLLNASNPNTENFGCFPSAGTTGSDASNRCANNQLRTLSSGFVVNLFQNDIWICKDKGVGLGWDYVRCDLGVSTRCVPGMAGGWFESGCTHVFERPAFIGKEICEDYAP